MAAPVASMVLVLSETVSFDLYPIQN